MLQISWNDVLAKMRKARQIANIIAVFKFLFRCDLIFYASDLWDGMSTFLNEGNMTFFLED